MRHFRTSVGSADYNNMFFCSFCIMVYNLYPAGNCDVISLITKYRVKARENGGNEEEIAEW